MVTCPICFRDFKQSLNILHLSKHGLTKSEFKKLYPNHPLKCEAYAKAMSERKLKQYQEDPTLRNRVSEGTKLHMTPEVCAKISNRVITDELRAKYIENLRKAANDPVIKAKMYTEERNRKIAEAKMNYWKTADKTHITNLWKIIKNKDEEAWLSRLIEIGSSAFRSSTQEVVGQTNFETRLYRMLENEKILFEKQFRLDKKVFDACLYEDNILIEFDGTFWHPLSLNECKFDHQVRTFHNDRYKDELAKKRGFKLFRIRENAVPVSIREFLGLPQLDTLSCPN